MAWPKGKPRPPGAGRKKGTQNKTTRDVQEWARSILEDPKVRDKTLRNAQAGRLAPAILIELMHYGYGKPKDTLALELPRPVVVDLVTERVEGDG
jgi:hypothetical protein